MDGSDFGFYRTPSEASEESFRFVWRTTVVTTRYDENGEEASEELQSFSAVSFSIMNIGRGLFMRVENPNRNLRDLMNAIEGAAGYGFSCSPVTFETERPKLVFDRVDESKLVSLKLVGAILGEDLVARMEFASKQGIDLEKMKILRGLRYKIDVAAFDCLFQGVRGQVSIAAGGLVRFSGPLTAHLRQLIERELPQIAKAKS
jgi:hypothetical protein